MRKQAVLSSAPQYLNWSIKPHNSSASHMKWALREKAESNPGSSVADKTMDQMGKATFDKMCKLFMNAHAIARLSRPYTDFVWMCTLDDMKGVQIGNTYRNDSSVQHLSITLLRHKGMKSKRNQSDGSTDNSHIEAALAYVQYCHQGSINVHFVGVKNIAKGDAQVIEVAMSTLFTDYFAGPSWEKKIVGTGTDGASTMLGKNNGFVAKLRQWLDVRYLITICH